MLADGESVEYPACFDRPELFRVAHEHNFRMGCMGGVEQGSELSRAAHRGFVNDQDGLRIEDECFFFELDIAECERVGWDTGLVLELACRGRCERGADDLVAVATPGVGCGIETERFAGPRGSDDSFDAPPGAGDRRDEPNLFGGKFGPCCERSIQVRLADDPDGAGFRTE